MPLAASALLMADEGDLDAAFAQSAPYLFHDRAARPVDQGVRSFQCSRRADALKVWIAWQRYGTEGFAAVYDHLCATTHAIWERVVEHPSFEAMHEPECNILCFRHVGDDDLNARLARLQRDRRGLDHADPPRRPPRTAHHGHESTHDGRGRWSHA